MKKSNKIKAKTNKEILKLEKEVEKDEIKIEKELQKEQDEFQIEQDKHSTNEEIEMSEDYVSEKLSEVKETLAPKKRKKSIIISLAFLLVNVVFMAIIMTNLLPSIGGDIWSLIASRGNNLWWLLGGVLMYLIWIFVQVVMVHELLKTLAGKKSFKLAYDVTLVGKYYDNVTPFAVGGQPMQIARLANHGVSAGLSTSIPVIKMTLSTFVNTIMIILFFIFGLPRLPIASQLNGFLMLIFIILAIIGVVVTILVNMFMFLLSAGNFITRSFISSVLRLGYKMKLVKNYRATLKKTINQAAEYRNSSKLLLKDKKLLLKSLACCLIESLSLALIVYFVIRAFSTGAETATFAFLIMCIVKHFICTMASSYIPLPGGTGLMEITFIFIFSSEVGDFIAIALLIWRILSYYSILLHGFVHEMILIGKNLAKARKQKQTA